MNEAEKLTPEVLDRLEWTLGEYPNAVLGPVLITHARALLAAAREAIELRERLRVLEEAFNAAPDLDSR